MEIILSLNFVDKYNPVIIPVSEKILLRKPFFIPKMAGISIMTQIIMSILFKLLYFIFRYSGFLIFQENLSADLNNIKRCE